MSHDLKNALTALTLRAQQLRRRARDSKRVGPGPVEDGLATIEANAVKIVAMCDDLLRAAGVPLGEPTESDRRPTDLVALARHAAAECEQVSTTHRIRLEPTEAPIIGWWNATQLARLLGNLLGNAVKFSPDGGAIDMRVSKDGDMAGEWAVLSVQDPGVGIPAADLPRVFEPLYRATNVRAIAGTGIGLASAKEAVEQNGGAVTVASEEGRGTTFTVRLPLDPGRTGPRVAQGSVAVGRDSG